MRSIDVVEDRIYVYENSRGSIIGGKYETSSNYEF